MGSGLGPVYLAMSAVWAYWIGVLVMALRARLQGVSGSGLVPALAVEKILWVFWLPVITSWILFPWLSITDDNAVWQLPQAARVEPFWLALRWLSAAMTWVCFGATIYCWRWMGQNWRVVVTTDDRTELISDGPFSRVRHPIYSISILMMLCTLLALPIWPLAIATLLHVILMNLKARNEERWMARAHGQAYVDYRGKTNRFFPGRRRA